ncbi:MAG: hypothetical protein HQ579_04135, partial [Candidatus Omnitrophica bacterium]|nr:hypothetical protein [Candidatus Omnitrophota bacterium]
DEYGVREVHFEDDNLTLDTKRARRIFEGMIEKKLNLRWTTPNGVALWTLNKDLLRIMKMSGCYELCFGIESGDERVLTEVVQKPLDLTKIKALVREAKRMGIFTFGFFIVGFPGETEVERKKTFDYPWKVGLDDASFNIATPFPGTRLFEICREKGYLKNVDDLFSYVYWKANIQTEQIDPQALEKAVARHTLLFRVSLMFRNPAKFVSQYALLPFRDFRFFYSFLTNLLKKIFIPASQF